MTDNDFYVELRHIVERRATAEHLVDTLAFVKEVAERLEDDPTFGEFVPAEHSGVGRRNRQFRLHGFTRLDEADGSVGVVIGRWSDADNPETLTTAAVAQLSSLLETFVQDSLKDSLAERITEANEAYELALMLAQERKKISRIRLHVLSNQLLSQRFKEQLCAPILGIAVERHVWDLRRLLSVYESSREREAVEIDLHAIGSLGIEAMEAAGTDSLKSYLCMIPANTLADLFERYGSRLLEGNVRSFLGMKGGVNQGIRRTIQNSPALFFAFNNGIAATAASARIESVEGRTRITGLVDLQIVNGGQTTASILSARKKERLSLEGVSVAMKLTVVGTEQANDLIPRIAEYANTQNKIAVADFFANHPIHRKMEEISRRLSAPATGSRVRSKWFYERARGQYQNERLYLTEARKAAFDLEFPSSQVINKTDLAKYDSAFHERPHWASLGAQKNFVKFASTFEPASPEISASDHWASVSPQYGDAYYQRIVVVAIIWKRLELIISEGRGDWYLGDFRAQIVAYAISLVLRRIRDAGYEFDVAKIWNLQALPDDLAGVLYEAAVLAQKGILSPPPGMTNVGEWTKKEGCWDNTRQLPLQIPAEASWIVSREVARRGAADARKQGAVDDGIAMQQRLLELASNGYWSELSRWPTLPAVATESQRTLVVRASTLNGFMRISSEKEWRRLDEIRRMCEEAGFQRT